MSTFQCSACATPCQPHPQVAGALAMGCDCDDGFYADDDWRRPRPVTLATDGDRTASTLQRIDGTWQLRAHRKDGTATLTLDTPDLGYALSVLQGFAS